jgi:uncharacterized damage-inducible protein DinB
VPERQVQELVDALAKAQRELDAQLAGIGEAELHASPREGEWSVAQVLCHVCEMEPVWIGKARETARGKEVLVERTPAEAESRLGYLQKHQSDTLAQFQAALKRVHQAALEAVAGLKASDLSRTGVKKDGTKLPVAEQVMRVARHIEEHARQVAETRRAVGKKD